MNQTTVIPPYINNAVKFILRSPLHGMFSKAYLLITFTGRKSGKSYTTPVGYSRCGDELSIFTHANWWKNLAGGAPVTLHIEGRECQGIATPVAEDKQTVAEGLAAHLRLAPRDARYYGVTFDEHGNPDPDQVWQAAQSAIMIRIRLC